MWWRALTSSARGIVGQRHRRRLESSNLSQTGRVVNSWEMPRQDRWDRRLRGTGFLESQVCGDHHLRREDCCSDIALSATVTNERGRLRSISSFVSLCRFEVHHFRVSRTIWM